tara:strand:- start:1 stop:186 length:186 start_codon:yes stop_codon:yes gene_type:complete
LYHQIALHKYLIDKLLIQIWKYDFSQCWYVFLNFKKSFPASNFLNLLIQIIFEQEILVSIF